MRRAEATRETIPSAPGRAVAARCPATVCPATVCPATVCAVTVCAIAFLVTPGRVEAGEFASYVREGNRLYAAGEYARAEEQYILSQEEQQDSAIARFNIGATYFQREDYAKAIEHWRDALGRVKADRDLEVRIRYNLATAHVLESERSIGDVTSPEKLQKGVELLQEAMAGYRDVLEIRPDHEAARHNLALCHLRIKNLFDTLKRLREEAEKAKEEEQGEDPAEILRQLIAEEEEEIGLTRTATTEAGRSLFYREQLARVEEARRRARSLADVDPTAADALSGAAALDGSLGELEADPSLELGGAEVALARRRLAGGEGPERVVAALDEAATRLDGAARGHETALGEALEADRSKQEATRNKARGFIQGVQDLLDGKGGGAAQAAPPGPGGQPPQPPVGQPPPPEVAAVFTKVKEHTAVAADAMDGALAAFGNESRPPALPAILEGQETALAALREALEALKELPQDEQQQSPNEQENQQGDENERNENEQDQDQQQQEGEQGDEGEEQDEQKKEGGENQAEQKDDQNGDQQEGQDEEQAGAEDEERRLSEEEAEELLRRFLRRDQERERRDRERRLLRGGGGRTVDKDW